MAAMPTTATATGLSPDRPRRRGVSLGLVGLLFMLATPVGLAVAWWHPLFREGRKRDPLLVLAVCVYGLILVGSIALSVVEE